MTIKTQGGEMYKRAQAFRYFRYIAKWLSLPFLLAGVVLLIAYFWPTFAGKGIAFWLFIIAGICWALDTFWETFNNARAINKEISEHEHRKS